MWTFASGNQILKIQVDGMKLVFELIVSLNGLYVVYRTFIKTFILKVLSVYECCEKSQFYVVYKYFIKLEYVPNIHFIVC